MRFLAGVVCVPVWMGMCGASAQQQAGLFARYEQRMEATQHEQPNWATPLVTIAPRLEQGLRTDFVRQSIAAGQTMWNYGGTKGLQFVPLRHVELQVSPPPFFTHSNPKVEDGFGDFSLRMKYRVVASPETKHNAIVTAVLAGSIPTGKSGNGSCCAILTPTLEAGKGFGKLDVIAAGSGTLPVTGAKTLGRTAVLNEALQYHATKLLWVETEFNSTIFRGGKNDGREQTFATPGVVVSRMQLRRGAVSGERLALTLAAGEQIALTHFNTYNHSPIFSARLRF